MDRARCDPDVMLKFQKSIRDPEEDSETKRRIICQVKIWCSLEKDPPIEPIIESDIMTDLIIFAENPQCDPKMLFDILWICGNMCSCSSDELKYMMTIGVDDFFEDHLQHSIPHISDLAQIPTHFMAARIWGFGNIAGDSPASRDEVLRKNVSPKLMMLLKSRVQNKTATEPFIQNMSWLCSQLMRGKPRPTNHDIQEILPVFRELISMNVGISCADALWGLSYITEEGKDITAAISKSGILEKILQYAQTEQPFQLKLPALRVIGNLVSCSDEITTKLIQNGTILMLIENYMEYDTDFPVIRKEVCWCLSNVADGTVGQARQLVVVNVLAEKLRRLLRNRKDPEIQKETMWIVTNLNKHKDEGIFKYLLMNEIHAIFATEINSGDKKMIDIFLACATHTLGILMQLPVDSFDSVESDKLVLLLHYFNTTMINIQPTIVTGAIRGQCKQIRDDIEKIKKKFNFPKNLEDRLEGI